MSDFPLWKRYRSRILAGCFAPGCLFLATQGDAADQPPIASAVVHAPVQEIVLDLAGVRHMALAQQPALAASRESLAAAEARAKAVERLLIPDFVQHDLPYRRHQSAIGVEVAQAGVTQAEWEAIYAATRNYFSVVYARQQLAVVDKSLTDLETLRDGIKQLVEQGSRKSVTERNLEKTNIYIQIVQARRPEALIGIERATAALREAIGLAPGTPLKIANGRLPSLMPQMDRAQLVEWGVARRGEMAQVVGAAEVVCYEIKAQGTSCAPTMRTFASASDIHAQQVPQGVRNGEYRPGALPLEMPPMLAGGRKGRLEQARALHARALAVVDKTRNLIGLEAEESYFRILETREQAAQMKKAADASEKLSKNVREDFQQSERTSPEDALSAGILSTQNRALANEFQYHYLLALAALERITAGGFNPGFETIPPAKP